jgi:hypothetical protein
MDLLLYRSRVPKQLLVKKRSKNQFSMKMKELSTKLSTECPDMKGWKVLKGMVANAQRGRENGSIGAALNTLGKPILFSTISTISPFSYFYAERQIL